MSFTSSAKGFCFDLYTMGNDTMTSSFGQASAMVLEADKPGTSAASYQWVVNSAFSGYGFEKGIMDLDDKERLK
jgi:hypothetical protein